MEDVIEQLQSIIDDLSNNYNDDYADGVVDGLLIAIKKLEEKA